MENIGFEVEEIIKELGLSEEMRLVKLRRRFDDMFPPPLSHHIWPASLRRGELLINVDSQVWLYEVKRHQKEFESSLAAYGVRRVRFRLGRIYHRRSPLIHRREIPEKLPPDLDVLIDEKISDPSVRNAVRSAMRAVLGRLKVPE